MLKFRWETKFQKTEIGEIPREWMVDVIKNIADINKKGDKKKATK